MTEPIIVASAAQLRAALTTEGATIQLRTADYSGLYSLSVPGVTLEPYPGDSPIFTGPAKPIVGVKPAWLTIKPAAKGATVRGLSFVRSGVITAAKAFNDFGIIIEAPDVTVEGCALAGMCKGLHIKGKTSTGITVVHNHIGPTYQGCIVVGTSYGVIRGGLIGWNLLKGSYAEDGIQFIQDFDAPDKSTDISNMGMIVYQNEIRDCNENAIDCKGAARIVIDGNVIVRTMGSNNGPVNGWNHGSQACIMKGAGASTRDVIIRNNVIVDNSSGPRVFDGWHVYHNRVENNNYSTFDDSWRGFGIAQMEPTGCIKNNLVSGNRAGDLQLLPNPANVKCNPVEAGPGVELTHVVGNGVGGRLFVKDAGYFTDWFGRADLPPEVLYLGDERYEVQAVDYENNTVQLDRDAPQRDGDPVYWRSPIPNVGIQEEYVVGPVDPPVIVEPPVTPTEPPTVNETVTLTLSVTGAPALALALREAVAAGKLNVSVETGGVVVVGAVEDDD